MNESHAEQIGNWCRHYNGLFNDTCKAGVRYDDVKDKRDIAHARGLARFPCFKDSKCAEHCVSASFLSEEEIAAEVERSNQALAKYLGDMANNICPFCSKPIEKKKQIGRCVYATPCYHRLYQGVVSKGERTPEDQREIDKASLWEAME